jgi:hypothetical protein
MPRAVKNAMGNVSAAANQANAAAYEARGLVQKLDEIIDRLQSDGGIDLEIHLPIEILGLKGNIPVNVRIKLPANE